MFAVLLFLLALLLLFIPVTKQVDIDLDDNGTVLVHHGSSCLSTNTKSFVLTEMTLEIDSFCQCCFRYYLAV